jgi:hypothetical protein
MFNLVCYLLNQLLRLSCPYGYYLAINYLCYPIQSRPTNVTQSPSLSSSVTSSNLSSQAMGGNTTESPKSIVSEPSNAQNDTVIVKDVKLPSGSVDTKAMDYFHRALNIAKLHNVTNQTIAIMNPQNNVYGDASKSPFAIS